MTGLLSRTDPGRADAGHALILVSDARRGGLTWIKDGRTRPLRDAGPPDPPRHPARVESEGRNRMWDWIKIATFGAIALLAAIAANWARDLAYQVHALIVMAVAAGLVRLDRAPHGRAGRAAAGLDEYSDGVIRAGVIATTFWGLAGFLVGVVIALQLAFPQLNLDVLQGFGNFGRLRPLHTSAVIFAFGGNALIMSTFYIVQRTSRGAALGRQPRLVRVLGLPALHRAGRDRLPAGRHPVQGIRRARVVRGHLADGRLGRLPRS